MAVWKLLGSSVLTPERKLRVLFQDSCHYVSSRSIQTPAAELSSLFCETANLHFEALVSSLDFLGGLVYRDVEMWRRMRCAEKVLDGVVGRGIQESLDRTRRRLGWVCHLDGMAKTF